MAIFTMIGLSMTRTLPESESSPPLGEYKRMPHFKSRVVVVRDNRATVDLKIQQQIVRRMVDAGIQRVTEKDGVAEAWQSLVSPDDVVGIKVYTAATGMAGTRIETVAAVVEGLLEANVPPDHVVVWDKQMSDLLLAGFNELERRYGIRLAASLASGYDDEYRYESTLIGQLIWGDKEFGKEGDKVGRFSYVSKLVTRELTKIINVSPSLNNPYAGTAGHLYSLSMGAVDNTLRFQSGGNLLATAVPEIYAMEILSDRVVMNITDSLICQFAGKTEGLLHYSKVLNELRFSADPVALDMLALDDIARFRKAAGMEENPQNRKLYSNAELMRLGTSDIDQILIDRVSLTDSSNGNIAPPRSESPPVD